MTLAVLILLAAIAVVLLGGVVLVAVTFSNSLTKALGHAERLHERSQDQLGDVLDRLTAKTLEEYKVYSLAEHEHGSFDPPERPASDRPWDVPGQFLPGGGVEGDAVGVGRDRE